MKGWERGYVSLRKVKWPDSEVNAALKRIAIVSLQRRQIDKPWKDVKAAK